MARNVRLAAFALGLVVVGVSSSGLGAHDRERPGSRLDSDGGLDVSEMTCSLDMPTLAWSVFDSHLLGMNASLIGRNGNVLWLQYVEVVPENGIAGLPVSPGVSPGVYEWEDTMECSLSILDVDSRGMGELFVLGHPLRRGGIVDESKTAIEQWSITYPLGSPVAALETSTVAMGSPVAESSWVSSMEGGEYQQPSARKPTRKSQEIVAELPGSVVCLEVDPNGRYLLYAENGVGIWQLDLSSSAIGLPPMLALSSVDYPSLSEVTSMQFRRTSGGQKTLVVTGKNRLPVFFPDANNDGVFEQPLAMTGTAGVDSWSTSYNYAQL